MANGVDGLDHLLTAVARSQIGLARGFGGGHRVTRDFIHCGSHLIHRRGGLFDFITLLMQASSGVFGHCAELLRGGSQLAG